MTPILNSATSQSLGALVNFTQSGSEISGTTTNGNFRITVFNESVFKVSISKTEFENFSYAVVGTPEAINIKIEENDSTLTLITLLPD
jgi:hypothetical protein